MGRKIPNCGFLVVKDPSPSSKAVSYIVGMNIISRCRQIVQSEFEAPLQGGLETDWRNVFQHVQTCDVRKSRVACGAGRSVIHVPAASITMVIAKGWLVSAKGESKWLLEPTHLPLPRVAPKRGAEPNLEVGEASTGDVDEERLEEGIVLLECTGPNGDESHTYTEAENEMGASEVSPGNPTGPASIELGEGSQEQVDEAAERFTDNAAERFADNIANTATSNSTILSMTSSRLSYPLN
ncbi:hypothetical protein G5714_021595 [Onychostoma macrolepis]|uniref:Uncharacterized protein n=1 Tax=Onychostoma macrolepis TaxID=369639 RepID=A0A7J6BRE5_9TELE|nr:hypothetical protein G5714_021595 [Onychostoma macrolepis]